jgi:hypothetical protein
MAGCVNRVGESLISYAAVGDRWNCTSYNSSPPLYVYLVTFPYHHHHHHHRVPEKILPDLSITPWIRPSGFQFFGFRNSNIFTAQGRLRCVQPPTWRTRSLYLCPQWQGSPVIPPGTGFPFLRLLRLAVLLLKSCDPHPHGTFPLITKKKPVS